MKRTRSARPRGDAGPARASGVRALAGNLALVLLSLPVGMLLSELGLRTLAPQQVAGIRVTGPFFGRYDPVLGWANRAGASGPWRPNPSAPEASVTINAQGYRGREQPYERTPGKRRALVLGDSVSFGFGVDEEGSFPGALRELLGDRWEVVNASVVGYGLDQSYLLFVSRAIRYRPDLILLKLSKADVYDLRCSLRFGTPKPYFRLVAGRLKVQNTPVPAGMRLSDLYSQAPLFDALYTRSHLYRLVFHRFSKPLEALTASQEALSEAEGLAVAAAILRRLRALAEGIGARLLVLAIPHRDWLVPGRRGDQAIAVDLARGEDLDCLDLWNALSGRASEPLYLPGDDVHFTAAGNRLIAEEILRAAF